MSKDEKDREDAIKNKGQYIIDEYDEEHRIPEDDKEAK